MASVKSGALRVIQSLNQPSSRRDLGSTVTKRPPAQSMWSMDARVHSLESATYKKSSLPTKARSSSQLAIWVVSSVVLPATTLWAIGTAPSELTVSIHTSWRRSGRWSLL